MRVQSSEKEVNSFLAELHTILLEKKFDIDTDLIIIMSNKGQGKSVFSTPYTLIDLNYNIEDVVERLKELSIREYAETIVDKDNLDPPLLYVFGKEINGKQIYIKLKIKAGQKRRVVCVSFHYAERAMKFPYAR